MFLEQMSMFSNSLIAIFDPKTQTIKNTLTPTIFTLSE